MDPPEILTAVQSMPCRVHAITVLIFQEYEQPKITNTLNLALYGKWFITKEMTRFRALLILWFYNPCYMGKEIKGKV